MESPVISSSCEESKQDIMARPVVIILTMCLMVVHLGCSTPVSRDLHNNFYEVAVPSSGLQVASAKEKSSEFEIVFSENGIEESGSAQHLEASEKSKKVTCVGAITLMALCY
ncbi:hypothetical protein D910_06628 [Dendroctonus ponderosae]